VHELGHVLGLNHTQMAGNTMQGVIKDLGTCGTCPTDPLITLKTGIGVPNRNLGSDDIAGIQAIYGFAAPSFYPEITSITGTFEPGGSITVNGVNFAQDVEVWLNSGFLRNTGSPFTPDGREAVKVVATSQGTSISVVVPSGGVESGGLHVLNVLPNGKCDTELSDGHPLLVGDTLGTPVNTIRLKGDTIGQVGQPASWEFEGAPASMPFSLYTGGNMGGSSISFGVGQTHYLDVGTNPTIRASGTTDSNGEASGSTIVPGGAAGKTIWYEVVVEDTFSGLLYDSNPRRIDIQ
jgi:hypothetical protein